MAAKSDINGSHYVGNFIENTCDYLTSGVRYGRVLSAILYHFKSTFK